MPPSASRNAPPEAAARPAGAPHKARAGAQPFAGLIDAVLVEPPAEFAFAGSIARPDAAAVWVWFARDIGAGRLDAARVEAGAVTADELEPLMPELLARARQALAETESSLEAHRRLRVQLGGDEVLARLPPVLNALRNRVLLGKAQAFGRAANAVQDDAALTQALQAMPLHDAATAALLMHAALGEVANPSQMITAVLKLAGNASETGIQRAGFGPMIDAMLAHAQNQLHRVNPSGTFADIDMTCRAVERFHRLVRAVAGYVELQRGGRWSTVLAALTKQVSERIEPRLREVVPDINGALRRARDGADRLDADRLLAAINGVYLLATLRECKDSLALNALFEQAWAQSGEALDLHVNRNLDLMRADPADTIVARRLDAAIKMVEIRFNPDYAETLRRARAAAARG